MNSIRDRKEAEKKIISDQILEQLEGTQVVQTQSSSEVLFPASLSFT